MITSLISSLILHYIVGDSIKEAVAPSRSYVTKTLCLSATLQILTSSSTRYNLGRTLIIR